MKLHVHLLRPTAISCSAIMLCLASLAPAAPTNAPAKPAGTAPAPAAAAPAQPEIPLSVFTIPSKPQDGKDPFFPRSIRPYGSTATTTKTNQTVVVDLVLMGISGPPPLATINRRTFAPGEEGDVVSGTRRIVVRCLEIDMQTGTVTIQVGSERRELRLKPGK